VEVEAAGPAPAFVRPAASGRLYARSGAERWQVPPSACAPPSSAASTIAFPGAATDAEAAVYLESLHADDLALACACIDGHDERLGALQSASCGRSCITRRARSQATTAGSWPIRM
jgi:hypothetical protein